MTPCLQNQIIQVHSNLKIRDKECSAREEIAKSK